MLRVMLASAVHDLTAEVSGFRHTATFEAGARGPLGLASRANRLAYFLAPEERHPSGGGTLSRSICLALLRWRSGIHLILLPFLTRLLRSCRFTSVS
jgi:hypothetical protein